MKELQTFLKQKNLIPIILPGCEAPTEEQAGRIVEGFRTFSWTRDEYLEVVQGAFAVSQVRFELLDGFWDKCIDMVKRELLRRLDRLEGGPTLSDSRQYLFDVEQKLENIKELMGIRQSTAGIQTGALTGSVVAVIGATGVGKTTLAKLVYDDEEVRGFFEGRVCWLTVDQKPTPEKICKLQEQILLQLAGVKIRIWSPVEGKAHIRQRLGNARVLICLDNVYGDGHPPIVSRELLGPGSCILKTTRDASVLGPGEWSFHLDVLSAAHAEQLFLSKAFGESSPSNEHLALVRETVRFCCGIPLALEILGAQVAKLLQASDGLAQWDSLLRANFSGTPEASLLKLLGDTMAQRVSPGMIVFYPGYMNEGDMYIRVYACDTVCQGSAFESCLLSASKCPGL